MADPVRLYNPNPDAPGAWGAPDTVQPWHARISQALASIPNPWGLLPPEARKAYGSLGQAAVEMTAPAAVRDYVDQSRGIARNVIDGNPWGAAASTAGTALAAVGAVPGGRLITKGAQELAKPIRAYHGSPHDFDKFDLSKIGTGEGAQAYGHGLYFAQDPSVAKTYQSKVSAMRGSGTPTIGGKPIDWDDPAQAAAFELARHNGDRIAAADFHERTFKGDGAVARLLRSGAELPSVKYPGHMYEVNIHADPNKFLDWDKPLVAQSPEVQNALSSFGIKTDRAGINAHDDALLAALTTPGPTPPLPKMPPNPMGANIYESSKIVPGGYRDPVAASANLRDAGISGIKYLDGGSRSAGQGSSNYVAFDDKIIEILRKYGLLPVAAGGAAAATMQPSEPQGLF